MRLTTCPLNTASLPFRRPTVLQTRGQEMHVLFLCCDPLRAANDNINNKNIQKI